MVGRPVGPFFGQLNPGHQGLRMGHRIGQGRIDVAAADQDLFECAGLGFAQGGGVAVRSFGQTGQGPKQVLGCGIALHMHTQALDFGRLDDAPGRMHSAAHLRRLLVTHAGHHQMARRNARLAVKRKNRTDFELEITLLNGRGQPSADRVMRQGVGHG